MAAKGADKSAQRFLSVQLENWRNFRSVDLSLESRAFFVGPNASGKTNLLDALRFLHDLVDEGGGFRESVKRRGGVKGLRALAARRQPSIMVRVSIGASNDQSAWVYELRFTSDNRGRPLIERELVLSGSKSVLDRPDKEDKDDPERLTQTYLEQVHANRRFREIADFLEQVRFLHIVPQIIREPDRGVGRVDDPYGGDFLEQIAKTNARTREARLRHVKEALRIAVPQLEDLVLARDAKGTPHLQGKYRHWRPRGAWQSEERFSDGTLRLLGLLWAVLSGGGPLLLEEPELSLHPEVVRFIPQMLARVQRKSGRQVLLSTHSSDLLHDEGIGLGEVFLLEPSEEGTEVLAAREYADIQALLDGDVSLGEAVMARTRPEWAEQLMLFGGGNGAK